MPTNFNTDFSDLTHQVFAEHVKQYSASIRQLESGEALYRDDIGTPNAYKVNFSSGNQITGPLPEIGQVLYFKANNSNSNASTLTIVSPTGELTPIPLVREGNRPVREGDILEEQVLSVIYLEDDGGGNGRFEIIGAISQGGRVGDIVSSYRSAISGYLEANGQVLEQAQYPELFSLIGLLPEIPGEGSQADTWIETIVSPPYNLFSPILFAQEKWYAVGRSGGPLLTSQDGLSWSQIATLGYWINGLVYGNGLFVAAGNSGEILTSPNAVTWTQRTTPSTTKRTSVAYGNGRFVAAGNYPQPLWGSADGINWSVITPPSQVTYIRGIVFANNQFVAAGSNTDGSILTFWTSPDGINWTNRPAPGTGIVNDIAYGNGIYLIVAQNGRVWTSPDGITWSDTLLGPPTIGGPPIAKVTFGNGIFLLAMSTSPGSFGITIDGKSHNLVYKSSVSGTGIGAVAFGNGTFVAGVSNSRMWTSPGTPAATYNPLTHFRLPLIPPPAEGMKTFIRG